LVGTSYALCQVKKRDIAYVPADDVLPVLDTVVEVLTFYAQFVLPKRYSKVRRQARVTEVARVMGLQHVMDSFVGGSLGMGVTCRGISGGERRRLSIGSALLKNPAMLVLDEPTSGLDSEMSMVRSLCNNLPGVLRVASRAS
jgi:ABC-type multidrug transport system ATPase subunit